MKNILFTIMCCAVQLTSTAAFTQVFKEKSYPASSINAIQITGIIGNYTFSKSENDSVQIKVVTECKDMKSYSEFAAKYTVNIDETGGKLNINTPKYSTSLGMLFYEVRIPERLLITLNLEEGNVSIKEMHVNMKITQQEGNLFTDNISGNFDLTARKLNITLRAQDITTTLFTGNSTLNFNARKGKAIIQSSSGDIVLRITNEVEIQADKKSDDLKIIVPDQYNGKIDISSDKRPIRLDFSEVTLNGTVSTQQVKCIAGQGGQSLRVTSQNAQVIIGNSVTLSK